MHMDQTMELQSLSAASAAVENQEKPCLKITGKTATSTNVFALKWVSGYAEEHNITASKKIPTSPIALIPLPNIYLLKKNWF